VVKKRNQQRLKPKQPDAEEAVVVLEGEVLPAEGDTNPDAASDGGEVGGEALEATPDVLSLVEADEVDDDESQVEAERGVVPYSPLDAYLAEIRRFTPLSKEDEHAAAVAYHTTKSPDAAYKLVSGSLWLVVKIARDYERVAKNVLDLIQEGNIGLMEAVRNFDPYRGVRFPSYAVWWIRAYIIRYIIANWRMVKIGTTQAQRKLFFNLKKESDRLEREGIYPSTKLLAEKLAVKEGEVIEMSQRLGGSDMSFDAPLQDDNESTLLSVIPSDGESAEEQLAKKQLQTSLASSVAEFEAGLSDKERQIFKGRVVAEDKLTLQELSDVLSLSKERVRQIENKLRDKLKAFVTKKLGSELDDWVER
jgi:RNA polymerase sigma-32 factor